MFLGYQNNKIMYIANTRQELENIPCISFDKIEETNETYFLYNGEYVTSIPNPTTDEQITELQKYLNETDWYVVRFSETGVEIPEEVKQKRQEAREKISVLRKEKS